jgi:hypothetical protein
MKLSDDQKKFLKKVVPATAFLAGLCCFTPVVLVFFGLSSVAFAASLSDTLYGSYKWVFRSASLVLLLIAMGWYLYKKEGVCSFDAVKRKRRKIINFVLLGISVAILVYVLWLYVIVEAIGLVLGIW